MLLAFGANGGEDAPAKYSVELHAREVDGDILQVVLAGQEQAVVVKGGRNIRVSGEIKSNDPAAAFAELLKRYPRLGNEARVKTVKGKGRRVTLWFTAASSESIFRLLGEVGGVNIIHPQDLPPVSISVADVPWDGVLEVMAARLGLREHRRENSCFLLPGDSRPEVPTLKKDEWVTARLEGVRAGAALDFLGVACRVPCRKGPLVSLHMRNSLLSHIVAAIAVRSGLKCKQGPAIKAADVCLSPASQLGSIPDAGKLKLAGLVTSSRKSDNAALIQDSRGKMFRVRKGDPVKDGRVHLIRRNHLGIKTTVTDVSRRRRTVHQTLGFGDSLLQPQPVAVSELRLAATLRLPRYSAAVFEKKGGGFAVFRKFSGHPGPIPSRRHPVVLGAVTGTRAVLQELNGKHWAFELDAGGVEKK
jgi:hypothetical protein